MRLKIMHHLEFVLYVSEKLIGTGQIGLLLSGQNTGLLKPDQRTKCPPSKNPRHLTASQHLDRLDEKFDFSDPSDTEFHIALLLPSFRHLRVNALLDRSDILHDRHLLFDLPPFR